MRISAYIQSRKHKLTFFLVGITFLVPCKIIWFNFIKVIPLFLRLARSLQTKRLCWATQYPLGTTGEKRKSKITGQFISKR